MIVRKPTFKIIYEGKDITGDMTRHVDDLSYTDNESGEADEILEVNGFKYFYEKPEENNVL